VLYAVVFALLSGYLTYLTVTLGGWAIWLLWPALGFAVLTAGYLGVGPGIFGKQSTGRFHPLPLVVLLPILLLLWLVWHLKRLLSRKPACHQIVPGLWLGRRPLAGEVPQEVRLLVDLTAEFCRAPGLPGPNCDYLTVPTLDGLAPPLEGFQMALQRVLQCDGPVYIYCALGHSRSATLAAAVLLARERVANVAEAERLLASVRPGVRLMPPQRRLLHRLFTPPRKAISAV
jgi:protein-tyrosine phosphatase